MVSVSPSGKTTLPSSLVADGMPPAIQTALGLSPPATAAAAVAAAVRVAVTVGNGTDAGSSSAAVVDLCGEDSDYDDSSVDAAATASHADGGSVQRRSPRSLDKADGKQEEKGGGEERKYSSDDSSSSSSSSSSKKGDYGRGKRAIKPVTVQMGRDRVKIANAYTVVGERYIYEDVSGAAVATRPNVKPMPMKAKKPTQTKPKPELTPAQASLKQRNAAVEKMKLETQARRLQFFRRHLEAIRPFVSPEKAARLEAMPLPAVAASTAAATVVAQQQPEAVTGGEMRDYQLLGLQFMLTQHAQGVPIILGDEMGLGKTLQSLAFLAHLHLERRLKAPSLVVCPLSVLASWMNEARRWVPGLRVLQFHTSDLEERKRQCREILPRGDYDLVVTTYEMVKNDTCRHYLVRMCHWSYMVLDEGHVIKNEATELAQTLRRMHLGNVLLLTGTPLQNNLRELWAVLNFLMPDVFDEGSEPIFAGSFNLTDRIVDADMLGKAHALLQPFMLRRLKVDVERGLPPRIETKVVCHLSEMQAFWYKRLLLKDADAVQRLAHAGGSSAIAAALGTSDPNAFGAGGGAPVAVEGVREDEGKPKPSSSDWKRLQMLLAQLRKACNHPYLFSGAETGEETDVQEMIESSGKLHTLDRLLTRLQARGHRVVIFSQWTHTLDILDDFLFHRGYRYTRLDGGTNRIRRQINIESFNAPNSPLFAFLMTTRAGGLGVNLQTADTVILYDSDWNPQADAQAMARVHRIGQTKIVHVYRLMTRGTIEERIMEKAEKKLYLGEHVNRDSLVEARAKGEEKAEEEATGDNMLAHLRFGADAVAMASGANEPLDDATLDAIVDRTRVGNEVALLPTLKADKKDAASFDAEKAEFGTRVLQGVEYERPNIRELGDISKEWAALVEGKKRKRQSRLEMIEGKGTGYGAGAVPVLRENNYDLVEGEASVFQRELKGRSDPTQFRDVKRKCLVAGRDFDHDDLCQGCFDGGELLCCDRCPSTYHLECLGLKSANGLRKMWACPQHKCAECNRGPCAAGGVIFRCVACPFSCCYDHKPTEAVIVAENARHEALGFPATQHTCYIHCSATCQQFAQATLPLLGPPVAARYSMDETVAVN